MIEDARVLREGFVPSEVVHRDGEVDHLSSVLEPIARGEPAETALLTGPSGAGKTCIARFTVDRLRQEHLDVAYQYVNCWQNFTRFRVTYRLLEGLGQALDVHRQSTPRDELVERLRQYDGPPCVVILDEVDQLEDEHVLYDLHQLPGFSMVLIANREEALFGTVDERLRSRLTGSERIRFSRYGIDELVAIMAARVDRGLEDGAVRESELERIADAAAGDARVALSVLRSAARRAQRSNADRITADVVEAAIPDARAEIRRKNLDALTPHQRTLYEIVADRGEVEPAELYREYRDRVEEPKSDRTVRKYLSKMAQYDLVVSEGTSRDRVYRRPDGVSGTDDR